MSDNQLDWQKSAAVLVFIGLAGVVGYSLPHKAVAPDAVMAPPPAPVTRSAANPTAKPEAKAATATKAPAKPTLAGFTPPPDSAIPKGPFGDVVRLGEAIFHDTQHNAPGLIGNKLNCSNCHLDRGRLASAAPLWAAYVNYPAYRSKNGHVNSFQERLQGCFRYSMNGKAPAYGSKVLVALQTYAYFLASGAPTGAGPHGYKKLKKPEKPVDLARGQQVYAANCALCHGADGAGQVSADGQTVFPPLWGAHSFNWGAGMESLTNASAFIKANMPLSQGGTLTDQQAWDVAAFMNSHERPQDPRFAGSVAETRKKYHDSPMSLYGTTVNGVTLGEKSPPSGIIGQK